MKTNVTNPTIAEITNMPLSKVRGKMRTGATSRVQFKIADVDDEHASSVIVADVLGSRVVIRSCDTGKWDQFIRQGF